MFVCPANLAHSPRRGARVPGDLVIERKRKADEKESFLWFCERCDALVLSRDVAQGDIGLKVRRIYEAFNADAALRTCKACGYVFAETARSPSG
jgi:3-hydroxyanthranilate 3,4-dioxygenase